MSAPRVPSPTLAILLASLTLALAGCVGPRATAAAIHVQIRVDGQGIELEVPAGTTAAEALQHAGVSLGALDRTEPPGFTVLTDGATLEITRVVERFEVVTVTLPFDHQTIRNEALPEGETRLLQPGQNGTQEITYRILEEGGIETSRAPVQTVVVSEPVPEIMMLGAQGAYASLPLEGTLAYLAAGNAWIMQGSSAARRPIVVSGDLDGRVFELSPDGGWLLFTRQVADDETAINSLWAVSTQETEAEAIDLGVENVVHFADWEPGSSLTVAFSTVEPSTAAPGWQAYNDLQSLTFNPSGRILRRITIQPANAGGQYGWWGTSFRWSSDGRLVFSRADAIGLIDSASGLLEPLLDIVPLQTLGDWAWVPGVTWGPDGTNLYLTDHGAPLGLESPAASQVFHVVAYSPATGQRLVLARSTGMFANPVASPPRLAANGEISYQVAYLQALSPLESAGSRYRLTVMDRDGSNQRALFPAEGETGLDPQEVAWSPDGARIAVIYRGDLWVVDVASGLGQPLTGDGQTTVLDWSD